MLLRFTVANHRSIRDEQELSLVAVARRGERRGATPLVPRAVAVAGIYGANASGKSNVLDALQWMRWAIGASQASWRPDGGVPRHPFTFDEESAERPSSFELDFVHDDIRHTYGFEVDSRAVLAEWLYYYPRGRRVRLYERTAPRDYQFGRALTGEREQIKNLTRSNALYLSSAAANDHPLLVSIYGRLTRDIAFAHQDEAEERTRLRYTIGMIADREQEAEVNRLLRFADLGISRVEVAKNDLNPRGWDLLKKLAEAFGDSGPGEDALREAMEWGLDFEHGGPERRLSLRDESAGTRTWLALIGPLVTALSQGSVLVVDELDTSLHPMLSSMLIRMFKDRQINRGGAQLVFASHDTTLLGSLLDDELLARDEVWFTAKDTDGATELFSLSEFHPRRDENVERGYLQGRYGAVPYLDLAGLRAVPGHDDGADERSGQRGHRPSS